MSKSRGWLRKHFYDVLWFWLQRKSEVARFEGIIISDPNQSENFRVIILAALNLVKDTDPRRFERIKKYLKWIVNCTLAQSGAQYFHDKQTCAMDFEFPKFKKDSEFNVAYFAKTLVHEATHGVVRSRNIHYIVELRSRIENLCVTEENRFVKRLALAHPELAKKLYRDYDASDWEYTWERTRKQSFWRMIYRLFVK
jgi:hypothetical protein